MDSVAEKVSWDQVCVQYFIQQASYCMCFNCVPGVVLNRMHRTGVLLSTRWTSWSSGVRTSRIKSKIESKICRSIRIPYNDKSTSSKWVCQVVLHSGWFISDTNHLEWEIQTVKLAFIFFVLFISFNTRRTGVKLEKACRTRLGHQIPFPLKSWKFFCSQAFSNKALWKGGSLDYRHK